MTDSGPSRSRFLGFYNPSVVLTYVGVAVAVVGMWLAYTGRLEAAVMCLVIAGLCDLFDGPIARRVSRDAAARRFGQEIDSLADMVSFVALPIVIAFGMGLRSPWWLPVLAGYALAGLIRLAHFNATTMADAPDAHESGRVSHYRGLPVTYSALILPLFILATALRSDDTRTWVVGGVIAALAVLFILDVPVRKPGGAMYAVFGAVAVGVVTALAFVEL